MEFRILGPLEVRDGERPIEIGGRKPRALLAVLLLHANEVVSTDVLIDELWGETPPATAAKTLQAHVSRLRKTLGGDAESNSGGRVETRGQGYLLRVASGELDAEAFRTMLEASRGALADGDPESAADGIRDALALWRGRPLADFAYESFAQAEIARLDELRLAAKEEWIEAQLALGRHAELVPELKTLVSANPLRERLLGQLMLALYRSDRQAEALHAYEEGRRALAEELGLEPSERLRSLERRILEHDPGLAAPPRRGRPRLVPAPVWRHPRVVVLLGAAVVIAAVAAAVLQGSVLDRGAGVFDIEGSAVAAIDTGSADVEEAVSSPAPVTAMATGLGFVWAASADASTVIVVDPKTNTVRDTIPVESAPGGIALGGGWVWVTNSLTGTVSQISPRTLSVVQPIRVGNGPTGIASDGRYVWVANTSDHTVTKLRASDGKVLRTFPAGPDPGAVAVGEGAVWIASKLSSVVLKLSPSSGEVIGRIPVGAGPAGIAVGAGSVWVASSLSGTVSRIDPRTGDVRRTVEVGSSADAIAVSGGNAWVASALGERVVRISARDERTTTIAVGDHPTALAVSEGTIYAGFRPSGASHFGGTLRLLFSTSGPPALDPANAYDPDWWSTLILTNDGLVGWRRTGGQAGAELVPDLAVSLPTVSADRRTYTFQLRRGIRYSDGRLVKASDVRYSFERLYKLKPEPHQAPVDFYRAIVGADRCAEHPSRCDLSRGIVTDDRVGTVSFRLASADPEFLFKLAAPFASVLPAATSLRAAVLRPLPATGPYRVASATRTGSVRLVRNPHFEEWSSAAQPRGFPDEILISPVADAERPEQLVAKGKSDYAATDPGGRTSAPIYETQLHVQPLAATFYLVLDTTRPPFDDVRARRAVNYAVDRGKVMRLVDGTERPTCQVLPPNFPAFRPYCPYTLDPGPSTWSAPDVAKAAALRRASRTTGAHVELWWHREFGEQAGRYIEQVLASLGYRVRLRLFSDYRKYFTGLYEARSSWQIAGTAWFADYPAASNFIRLLSCSFDSNFGRFCDEAIDRRIDSAFRLQERDPAAANQAWARLDRDLTNEAAWVPLYTPYSGDFVSKRVGNYQKHPFFGPLFGQFWVR
jgi:YVTN family beta-propeller protein